MATPLVILSIGGTPLDLGMAYSLAFLPVLLLAPVGGAIADRIPKRAALMVLQSISAGQASIYAFAVATQNIEIWHVFILSAIIGLVNAVEMPSRNAFIAELLPDTDMRNGVALMMVAFNGSRIIGPGIAGIIAAAVGFEANFLCSAAAALSTLGLLGRMDAHRSRQAPGPPTVSIGASLVEGLGYARNDSTIRTALAILATFGVFGLSFQTIAPVYALEVVGLDTSGYGMLLAVMGLGAFGAAVQMTLVTPRLVRPLMLVAPIVFGVLLIALSMTEVPARAFAIILPLGFFSLLVNSSVSLTIQGWVPHELRGRMMGLYISVMDGGSAIGALLIGATANWLGVEVAMIVGGGATSAAASVFLLSQVFSRSRR